MRKADNSLRERSHLGYRTTGLAFPHRTAEIAVVGGSGCGIGRQRPALREAVREKFDLPKTIGGETVGGGTVGVGADELYRFVYTGLQSTAGAYLCFDVFLTLAPEPSSDNLR